MKRLPSILLVLLLLTTCGRSVRGKADHPAQPQDTVPAAAEEAPAAFPAFGRTADGMPKRLVFGPATDLRNCFSVVSKVNPVHLSVYERRGEDTVLLAVYPACVARNYGQKARKGDNKTPESWPGKPFRIKQIQDSHTWEHDFGDGRGRIPSYGRWFLRLETPGFSGIGIHGSTNNRASVADGRGSEGCIRLLDEDIIHFHDQYARVGMGVVILPEGQGPLPFEERAVAAALAASPRSL